MMHDKLILSYALNVPKIPYSIGLSGSGTLLRQEKKKPTDAVEG